MSLSAPTGSVAICNLALSYLKQAAVNQIDPPSTNPEKICANWFAHTRRKVLRKHVWNFAIKRKQLTKNTGQPPVFGFTSAFDLPNDFLRLVTRHDASGNEIRSDDYQIESSADGTLTQLLMGGINSVDVGGTLMLRYVADNEDYARWDPMFLDLMAIELAISMAPYFSTNTNNAVSRLQKQRDDIYLEAVAVDGQDRPPVRIARSRFREARQGFRRGYPGIAGPYIDFGP